MKQGGNLNIFSKFTKIVGIFMLTLNYISYESWLIDLFIICLIYDRNLQICRKKWHKLIFFNLKIIS